MALLAIAGIAKLADPGPAAGALRAAGLPHSRGAVRSLAALELGIGMAGLVVGGPVLAALAASVYIAFALFVAYALRNDLSISSCGCLGAADAPPTRVHVFVNIGIAVVLGYAVLHPLDPVSALVDASVDRGLLALAFSGIVVYLLYALFAVMPIRHAITRQTPISLSVRAHRPS